MRGRRPDQQDTIAIVNNYRGSCNEHYFGLFDGHGGTVSAEVTANCLHQIIAEHLTNYESSSQFDLNFIFTSSFKYLQRELGKRNVQDGTAANIVYIRNSILYVANAGDARSVLSRDGIAYALSRDHKPENADERERIEELGGFVTESKRVNGVLALSRALGDCDLQPPISCEPVVTVTELLPDDNFIIMGCDGLWDMISNEKAVELIQNCHSPAAAAVKLRDYAYTLGSTDNISVIVIAIHYTPPTT